MLLHDSLSQRVMGNSSDTVKPPHKALSSRLSLFNYSNLIFHEYLSDQTPDNLSSLTHRWNNSNQGVCGRLIVAVEAILR